MTTVMGIDIGIHKVSYAVVSDNSGSVKLMDYGTLHAEARDGTRTQELHDLRRRIIYWTSYHKLDYIFIEEGILGNNRRYSLNLAQTTGAILSGLVLFETYMVNISTWKKAVVGNGRATKEEITSWLEETHPGYAERCEDQDQRDATCVALYGLGVADRAGEAGMGELRLVDTQDAG